jgi:hypothetical protein
MARTLKRQVEPFLISSVRKVGEDYPFITTFSIYVEMRDGSEAFDTEEIA